MKRCFRTLPLLLTLCLFGTFGTARAQDDVMMQAFYWDVPVDDVNLNGSWWDTLAARARGLAEAGVTGVWTPSPAKGNFGIYDMGYGLFDHYDLGNYNQKGTTETRFGSRAELLAMIDSMHTHGVEVYVDVVLNHIYTGSSEEESNPAVKQYIFDEAKRDLSGDGVPEQYSPYPTNEIRWRIPNAQPGDYYVKIKGFHLNCGASHTERGYDLSINWDGSADQPNTPSAANWESEPNGGGGQFNVFPGSGKHVWAHANTCGEVDEYKVTVSSAHDLDIRLEARRENGSGGSWEFAWADQTNGYYPAEIWYNGTNLAATTLQARANTGVSYVTHTGSGEPNYTWNYTHFHPVDNQDYLGYPGSDEIIPNTKFFGNDLNTYNSTVQDRLEDWGAWLTNTVGYDGYRLDFVRGFQEDFVADWIKAMPLKSGNQRFVVGEYWGSASRIKSWVNALAARGADADGFDFPLKSTLTSMANGDATWDMRWLNHAGMVRDNGGNSLPGTSVVTFVDNHDTGKEHDKWVTQDWDMAYAYLLFAEGRPTIFYPHYYGIQQVDAHNASHTVQAPSSLQADLKKLMHVRRTYLDGGMIVLSDVGNPYPSGDAANVYVARRQGNGTKSGAILVLNNHATQTKGLWVDNAASGYPSWANKQLVNATNGAQDTTQVYNDGRVYVWAPPRGYAVWVRADEYVAFTPSVSAAPAPREGLRRTAETPGEFRVAPNYPNPFNPRTAIVFELPEAGRVTVRVYNVLGQVVATLADAELPAGRHEVFWQADPSTPSGLYHYSVSWNGRTTTNKMLLVK